MQNTTMINHRYKIDILDGPMALIDTMGGRFKLAREDLGLTQTEVAEFLVRKGHRSSPSHISRLESNERGMAFEAMVDAADLLGVSLDYIAGRDAPSVEVERFETIEANEIARMVDRFDADFRQVILYCIQKIYESDREQRRTQKEHALFLADMINQPIPESEKIRARSILDKIGFFNQR